MKYNKTFREALKEVQSLKEDGHTDVASAVRQCKTAIEDASQMLSKLQGMDPEGPLPSWWMNKIAIAADNMKAFVFDDPDALFEVKVDDTNGGIAQVGSNANIATYSAGSTNTGVSAVALDGGSFATSNAANFRVVSLSTDPDNSDYTAANASIIVKINLHSLSDTTGV